MLYFYTVSSELVPKMGDCNQGATTTRNMPCSYSHQEETNYLRQITFTHTKRPTFEKGLGYLPACKMLNVPQKKEKVFFCSKCDKTFARSGSLKKHKISHTEKKTYALGHITFTHTKRLTGVIDPTSVSISQPICPRTHKILHKKEKKFSCLKCYKVFSVADSLKRHKWFHMTEKTHPLDQITFTHRKHLTLITSFIPVSQSIHLKTHKMSQIKERTLLSSNCDKTFARSGSLKKHKMSHIADKTYPLGQITFTHTQRSTPESGPNSVPISQPIHLQTQKMSHNRKNFKCDKTFSRSGSLKKHNLNHREYILLACTQCEANFVTSDDLLTHNMTHAGESYCQHLWSHSRVIKTKGVRVKRQHRLWRIMS